MKMAHVKTQAESVINVSRFVVKTCVSFCSLSEIASDFSIYLKAILTAKYIDNEKNLEYSYYVNYTAAEVG